MTWTVATYLAYLLTAVPITVWVATVLSRNGGVLLADIFDRESGLAEAVNTLLVVGFYLINLGFVMLFVRGGGEVADVAGLLRVLSLKIGTVMLVLGVMHFLNVMVFSSMRRHSRREARHAQAPQPFPYAQQPQH